MKYRVAVIGHTGKGNYGHDIDKAWLDFDKAELVAVADPDAAGRERAAKRLGVANAYADYREMLRKEKPNVVSVAPRWPDSHKELVLACVDAGASIFLEKPMATTLAECDAMIAACEKSHVKVAIAHQTRYSPRVERIQELIADGRLGDITELRGRGKEDHRGGGEDLMVLGTHIMDLMRLFAGDAAWCFGRCWAGDRVAKIPDDVGKAREPIGPILGDRITATYGFDKPITGFFGTHKAKHGAGRRFGLFIHGTKGVVLVRTGTLPEAYFLEDPAWLPKAGASEWVPITSAGLGKPEPLTDGSLLAGNRLIVRDLIAAIEEDRQPKGSMYDGRAALEMILAVYESHRQGRPVDMPLGRREHPLGDG